jgi:imipenem/basic amino acid-specific outer membrane pore
MGEIALGSGTDTDGVTAAAIIYKGIPGLTLQAWDYYAHDILNALYLQGDYGWNCLVNDAVKMNASLQVINQTDVGDALAGAVDSTYWAGQIAATYSDLTATFAYSQTDDATNGQDHGILTPWGGMPAFTQAMVVRHQFFSDTTAMKMSLAYNFTQYNLKVSGYYASFDVGDAGYATNMETTESGFDFIYEATSNLQVRFRGNFPENFGASSGTPFDWSEYRLIVNYKF